MKTFEAMDVNKDGRLSKDEVLVGYTAIYGADLAEVETQRIMEIADIDGNGTIDYTEFINATLDKNKAMTQDRLRMAFDFFDKVSEPNMRNFVEPQWVHKPIRDKGCAGPGPPDRRASLGRSHQVGRPQWRRRDLLHGIREDDGKPH